jgi:predicted nucleotidyltransferase
MSDSRTRPFIYKGKTLEEWLPSVVERVAENFDPLRIVLFGSLARGEVGYDSNIDLLLDEDEWEKSANSPWT